MNLLLKTNHVTPIAGRGCLGEKLRHAVKMPEAEGLSPESNMGMLSCYLIGNYHRTSTPTNKALLRGHQIPPEAILLGLLTIVVAVPLTISMSWRIVSARWKVGDSGWFSSHFDGDFMDFFWYPTENLKLAMEDLAKPSFDVWNQQLGSFSFTALWGIWCLLRRSRRFGYMWTISMNEQWNVGGCQFWARPMFESHWTSMSSKFKASAQLNFGLY